MKDRYKLDLFYPGNENNTDYFDAQVITDEVFSVTSLRIASLAMDFPHGTSVKYREELEGKWIDLLPRLDFVRTLSIRHRASQEFFEAVCRMNNLEQLHFWTSTAANISSISKLQSLKIVALDSFSRLTDVRPILQLRNLQLLSIENSFKIENYEVIWRND